MSKYPEIDAVLAGESEGCIITGDCLEVMADMDKNAIPLVITDPPYLVRAGHGGGVFGERAHLTATGGFTDGGVDYSFLDGFQNWFVCCSLRQLAELLAIAKCRKRHNLITWCKPNPVPTCCNKYLPDVEYIVHGFTKGRLFGDMKVKSCFSVIPCGNKVTKHPNEKPLALIIRLVVLGTKPRDIILDPFCGSGTTCVAAKKLGRRWIGIEIDEKYAAIARRRIQNTPRPLFKDD